MALINSIDNQASITYGGATINSNTASTLLLLPPLIIKVADLLVANIGDSITYTITITNVGLTSITNLPFSDIIPAGAEYIVDSFKLNDSQVSPTFTDNTLTYNIASIGPLGIATISFQVEIIGGYT